jgi:hypothetical protein
VLFLFWGGFFVEHLQQWFVPHGRELPAFVWVAQMLHALMLVGLGLMLWKEKPGIALTVVATLAFFLLIGRGSFLSIGLLNLLPVLAFAASWATSRPAV